MADTPSPPAPFASASPDAVTDLEVGSWSGAEPLPEEVDKLVGTTVADTYTILRVLGEGGMGRVYEAQHTRIKAKRFALKTLHAELARQPELLARFRREAEAAAAITSPHVVGVYDVHHTADGRPFIVGEYLQGQQLGDHVDRLGKLPPAEAVHIVRQICKGLAAAHAQGVVHRDIKPENVFLTGDPADPMVKILDFGISRLDDDSGKALTKTGMVMGTPSYMAPEQARGDKVDHRTDLYATGAILYHLLTGQLPFDRRDGAATVVAVLTEEPRPPRSIDPSIPHHLELIVQRAMAKSPKDRFQTMDELSSALLPFDTVGSASQSRAQLAPTLRSPRAQARTLQEQDAEIRSTRPVLGGLLLGALLWAVVGIFTTITAVIRWSRGGVSATVAGTESLLVLLAVACALATPAVLLGRHVFKSVWGNTAKVLELCHKLRDPLLVGISTYGLLALLLRLVETLILQQAAGLGWPFWDILLFLASVAGAAGVVLLRRYRSSAAGRGLPFSFAGVLSAGTLAVLLLVIVAAGIRGDVEVALGPATAAETDEGADREPSDDRSGGGAATASATGGSSSAGSASPPPAADPKRAAELFKKFRKEMAFNKVHDAITTLEELVGVDPNAAQDQDVQTAIINLTMKSFLLKGEESSRMMTIITDRVGSAGPDILFVFITTRGGSEASRQAAKLLEDAKIRARGTPAFQIAYDLRVAASCDEVVGMLERAKQHGDDRTLTELRRIKYDNCRRRRIDSCCMSNDDRLNEIMNAVMHRPR